MRIAIVGAGGVGGYFGGRLAKAGEEVVFVARGRSLEALRTGGLRVESIAGDLELGRVDASDDPRAIGPVDAVLVATKAWQVAEVAPSLKPLLSPRTVVVPLENGIEAPDVLAKALGREHVLGGLCSIVSWLVEPGHVRHVATDPLVVFGELDDVRTERAERLLAAFRHAGVRAEIPPSIMAAMWTKFLFITPMSGMGAITRAPIGVWRSLPETRAIAEACVAEVVAVARAKGVALAGDPVAEAMARFDALEPEATASLQRDVMEGRPSELDAQIGAVVRMGRELAVATPMHAAIYSLLLPQENAARASGVGRR